MDGERWREVKELFNAAIAQDGKHRASFLTSRCNGDNELRREVDRLIAAHERAGEFIETPAFADAPEFAVDNADALVGTQLGRYRIESVLGVGGMGVVYLARDELLDRKVGLKLLPPSLIADVTQLERLKREARTASALNHPNIVTIHEVGEVDGTHYITTEFIEGTTLRERMVRGRIPPDEALEIALQIASALAIAHTAGIVHRDIKPENIMLRPDGYVKVLDFGIAQFTPSNTSEQSAFAKLPLLTQRGVILGTTRYMSPEQARAQSVDARSDVWSLGVVLYEMVSGAPPFDGPTSTDVVAAVLLKEPTSLEQHGVIAPRRLRDVVAHALQKDPARRFQTAKEMLSALRAIKESALPPLSRLLSPVARRRTAALVAATTLALVVAGVVYLSRSTAREIDSIAVLPFQNANAGADAEYLVDGLTEGVMHHLAVVPGIRVTARATAFTFKGRSIDPKELGSKLDVDCLVNGRVERQADKLSVHVDLVRTSDGSRMWAAHYQRGIGDLATLHAQIGADISAKLRPGGDRQAQRLTNPRPIDPAAYRDYLKGRFFQEKRTQKDLRESVSWFNQAIEKDPTYAQAYAGLAESYLLFADYDIVPPRDAFPKALAAARSALQFDENLADAHLVVAAVRLNFDWDLPAAEEAFRHALRLNPNHSAGYNRYGKNYLLIARRFDEAIAAMERAFELDPLSPIISSNLGETYAAAGRFDDGVEQLCKTMLMHPGFAHAYFDLGLAYLNRGEFPEALKQFEAGQRVSPDSPATAILIGAAQAFSGNRAAAAATLEAINETCARSYCPKYMLAILHTALGNKDEAFGLLQRALEERASELLRIEHDPLLGSLRGDPRFAELRAKVVGADRDSSAGRAIPEKSIAVLPFADLSPEGNQQYFSDGMAEEILHALAQVKDLKVAGRNSSFSVRSRNEDPRKIAAELGVAHILSGSVRKQGNQVRITAQLSHASDGFQIWSETFQGELSDVFSLQERIARAIAGQLKVVLAESQKSRLVRATTRNPEAYNLFLQASAIFARRDGPRFADAESQLQEALRLDPKFGRARARLAELYSIARAYDSPIVADPEEAVVREAKLAIELDPSMAEPHAALGQMYFHERRYVEARAAYERALQLDPTESLTNFWLAALLNTTGYIKASAEMLDRLLIREPMMPNALLWRARAHLQLGEVDQAERLMQRAADAGLTSVGIGFAEVAHARGDNSKLTTWLDKGLEIFLKDLPPGSSKLIAAGTTGGEAERTKALALIEQYLSTQPEVVSGGVPFALLWLREPERALAAAQDKPTRNDNMILYTLWTPAGREARRLPSFSTFVRRAGLAAFWDKYGPPDLCERTSSGEYRCD